MPDAATVRMTVAPAFTVCDWGCVAITGGVSTVRVAAADVTLPELLETITV
jgi:hypothetical protein